MSQDVQYEAPQGDWATSGVSIAYGGCAFRLRGVGEGVDLPEFEPGFMVPLAASHPPPLLHVDLFLEAAPSSVHLPSPALDRPRWTSDAGRVRLEFAGCRADVTFHGSSMSEVRAVVDGTWSTTSALLSAVTAMWVQRTGGLVLHAVGIEMDGRGVLFVGPSGAGKTTAANLCSDARWMALDRAVVWPTVDGPRMWGLVGGSPCNLPRSGLSHVPLAAVLRIRRGDTSPTLDRLDGLGAVFALRESTFAGADVVERESLEAIDRLRQQVLVWDLATVLGCPLGPLLRSRIS